MLYCHNHYQDTFNLISATFKVSLCLKDMKHLYILAVTSIIAGFSSCKGKEDPREVGISISSPMPGAEYDKGDTVWLKGEVTSNLSVGEVRLRVCKLGNDSLVYFKETKTDGKSASISAFFINGINPHADLEMTLQTADEKGNETGSRKVRFHCHAH
jgi:hypothetical protein